MGAWYTDQEREEVAYLAGDDDPGPPDAWEEMADELRSCVASLRKLGADLGPEGAADRATFRVLAVARRLEALKDRAFRASETAEYR